MAGRLCSGQVWFVAVQRWGISPLFTCLSFDCCVSAHFLAPKCVCALWLRMSVFC